MITIDHNTGLIDKVKYIPSPNCNDRPFGMDIDLLVIHGISLPAGEFGGEAITALFTNSLDKNAHASFTELTQLRVSAHVVIRRNGEIIQYVPFHRRAWHAGESCYEGRSQCNDFSIGIELEGTDTLAYEFLQYEQLISLTRALMQCYPKIALDRIVGHCDIAPQRKTDPGPAFDWKLFKDLL